MPYASGRTYFDADSHLMELPGWLEEFADPALRPRLRPLQLGGAGALAERAIAQAEARRADPQGTPVLEDVMRAKGWGAFGAFDPQERSQALDMLGFSAQLVFSTFSATQFAGDDEDLLFGGASAHNRAISAFCEHDPRLLAVGFAPWGTPSRTVAVAREALDLGCSAVLVPSLPPRGGLSPTHPDYDPFWATLEERDVPFMLHVGGGGPPVKRAFHNNGKTVTDFLGGGENIRSKDFLGLHHMPEVFLGSLVLDGVLERFPSLRGGCIELGALWVVPWLERLDIAQRTFARTEPDLAFPLRASEYVHRQLWFTPFPTEPVGWLIDQAGPDLFLFSSDFPHPEGGHDPLGRFETSLAGTGPREREAFFATNFAAMMGGKLTAT